MLALTSAALVVALPAAAFAQDPNPPESAESASESESEGALDVEELLEMSLEELLDVEITVATRTRIRLSASPSTVSVITSDEIRRRQYRSIAEALRTVPGLYDVNDLVLHNVGIRGVSGGLRAGGSLLKLMIDGTPVSFAPTTGNFFGPELVPIELVERIEVIRGPASALYGSNAFLGVVNVVTRTVSELPTATLYAAGGAIRNQPTATGGVILARAFGPVSLLLSVEASRIDRSRLSLPPSSPILDSSSIGFAPNTRSLDDLARPLTFFGRLEIDEVGPGRLELMSSVQRLDSIAELSDVEPMTHRSRTVLGSQTLRLGYVFDPIDTRRRPGSVELRFDVAYFRSSPGNQDRINLGSAREVELRRVRTHGVLISAELHASPTDDLSLVAVADVRVERHRLQHYDRLVLEDVFGADGSVQLPAGSILRGSVFGDGEATFINVGFQGQLEYTLNAAWRFTAGARVDVHSVYGAEVSPRLAIVLAPEDERYHLKLMFGSSFKAPSAEQLYTSPVRTFDIEGNPNLDEQTARTIELASGYELGEIGTFAVTGFATQIRGRVQYLQEGLFLSAQNSLDEWYAGAEVELRLVPYTGVDIQLALAHARLVGRRGDERRVVIPAAEVDQPLYPELQLHLQTSYESRVRTHPGGYVRFSYVGARAASEQNAALAGAPYDLPAYVIVDLAATMRERFFGGRETRIGIEVENLFDERFVDPGFGGVDLPSLGRSFFLTFAQEL